MGKALRNKKQREEKKEHDNVPSVVIDESRRPYTEFIIGYERWTHNTFKVELVFKFVQEEGDESGRLLIGDEYFYNRTGEDTFDEGRLVSQVDFTEALHVIRIREEKDHVCENFSIDVSLTSQEFVDASLREAKSELSEEDFVLYKEEVDRLCEGQNMDEILPAYMEGLYEATVWVRVPDFQNTVAKAYLFHFHSIKNGDQWTTREIELSKKKETKAEEMFDQSKKEDEERLEQISKELEETILS
jgi:hypothetical protein